MKLFRYILGGILVAALCGNAVAQDAAPAGAAKDNAQKDAKTQEQNAAADSTKTVNNDGTQNAEQASGMASDLPDADGLTDVTLDKTLQEVTTRVDTLKEDTFTTKSRLLLLREEVLQRSVSGSRLIIRHKDEMGGQYELRAVLYVLDNNPGYSRIAGDSDAVDIDDEVVFDGVLAPGTHLLSVRYVYRGKKWGLFDYMHNYAFVVESGYSFIVDEGKIAELTVIAEEKGNFFTPYEERPNVSYAYEQQDISSNASGESLLNGEAAPEN